MHPRIRLRALGLLTALAVVLAAESRADVRAAPANARFQAECGSCHVAYPPPLLPAESWRDLMRGLAQHFGVDASLDPEAAAEISAYLATHAGTGERVRPVAGVPRITQTRWFSHKHEEVPPAVWKRTAVGGPSNCGACHPDAASGRFGEHDVRLPR